jgi:hypothetical protein
MPQLRGNEPILGLNIISEKELVNIVLNGLPKTWDAFVVSMNTRKEYPLKNFGLVVLKKNQESMQNRKPQNKYDDQAFTERFKNFRDKRKFDSRRKPKQRKDISEIQCFNYQNYGHYKNQCPELKKKKEKHEASVAEEKRTYKEY